MLGDGFFVFEYEFAKVTPEARILSFLLDVRGSLFLICNLFRWCTASTSMHPFLMLLQSLHTRTLNVTVFTPSLLVFSQLGGGLEVQSWVAADADVVLR